MKELNIEVFTLLFFLSSLILIAVSKISSTLFFSTAEVKITETHGRKSNFSDKYHKYLPIIFSLSIFSLFKTASHLLITIISHFFSSKTLEIIDKSC
jgi:hypothetical protein